MNVVLTRAAEADLESIADHIAQDNPARAVSFVEEIVDCCHRLLDAPHAYALVPRYEGQGIRRRIFGNYFIFYRVSPQRIEVMHILHGARDYERILFSHG